MLEAIVNFLNLKLELLNYFEKRHCLSVLVQNDKGLIYPAEYISEGNYNAIDFDAFDGVSYLRVNGEINVDRIDQKYTPKPRVDVTFPLRLIYAVRKDKLTADDAYSFDRVRASIAKQLESDSNELTIQLNADKVQISTSGYVSDAKEVWDEETNETGQFQPKFDVVFGAMDVNVVVTTRVKCIPAECDDFESDILRTFDFCKPSVFDRLTPTQVSCLEAEICSPCADATVTNQAEDYSLSIASGATEKLPFGKVKNKEGNDVQVDYIPAADGYIFEETACPASLEVTVALSDTTPRYDEVITVTATATGATSYTFYLPVQDGSTQAVTQASNTYNWKVKKYGAFTVVVTATDGVNSGVGSAGGTTSGDVNADAFISAHNAATGGTMDATMQANTLGFFLRLKGVNTTFYEDVFTQLLAANAELYPMIPDDVSGASVAGYSINAIDPTRNATMVGFVAGDATVDGLTGGTGKYMIMNNAPSDYGQDDIGLHGYVRSVAGIGSFDGFIGSCLNTSTQACLLGYTFTNRVLARINISSTFNTPENLFLTGFISSQRNLSDRCYVYHNADPTHTQVQNNSVTPYTGAFFGMAYNAGGSPQLNFDQEVTCLINAPYLEECALKTLEEAVEWLQTQIGRNV